LIYNEITARLGVSKSSVSLWVRLTVREILIAGAIAYWCEGAKAKPHRQHCSVVFINSDPGLIGLFLRFLDAAASREAI
jgi:hypothetical protein